MILVREAINSLLRQEFLPEMLEIVDDSHRHQGHREGGKGRETHFTVFIVSSAFEGKRILQRHRLVQGVLKDLLTSRIHALSLKIFTPREYQALSSKPLKL